MVGIVVANEVYSSGVGNRPVEEPAIVEQLFPGASYSFNELLHQIKLHLLKVLSAIVCQVFQLGKDLEVSDSREVVVTVLHFGCNEEASESYQFQSEVHDGMLFHEVV